MEEMNYQMIKHRINAVCRIFNEVEFMYHYEQYLTAAFYGKYEISCVHVP